MAALSNTNLTLLDWAKRRDPSGKTAAIAMLLSQTNQILEDAVYRQGNLPTGHRVTICTGLPTAYWRSLNMGVPSSKATTAQVDEPCSILEARSETDIDLLSLEDDEAAFRLSESRMFIESMNQTQATTLFYGNAATDPKSFTGFAPRYSSTSAGNGQNVILGGGTVALSQTSVYLVCWGDETIFCPFPKGSMAGLQQRDLGEDSVTTDTTTNAKMQAKTYWFQWKNGLVVKDWRYAVRIANVEPALLSGLTGVMAPTVFTNLLHKMAMAVYRIPNLNMGRCAWYMNRTVHSGLSRLAFEKSASVLAFNQGINQFGSPSQYLSFMGIPIRLCDAIINTEAVVA